MAQRYNAFLVRHWALDDEQGERAELTHLQSGERVRFVSLAEALAWMHARGAGTDSRPPPVPAGEGPQADAGRLRASEGGEHGR